MQARMGAGTQTPNVARVLRNFRAKKNNVDHLKYCRKHTELTPLPASRFPKPHTTYSIPMHSHARIHRHEPWMYHESTKPATSRFSERAQSDTNYLKRCRTERSASRCSARFFKSWRLSYCFFALQIAISSFAKPCLK